MALLASRIAAGGAVGDVIGSDVIVRVFADSQYGFAPKASSGDLFDTAANKVAMPAVGTKADGYQVKVATNGLVYEVRDGAYVISDYETEVTDLAARDALTEQETGQRVYIDALDRVDRWDGTAWVEGNGPTPIVATYADLPNPTTLRVGSVYRVVNDPTDSLNGSHQVMGADPGNNGTYFDAV